MDKSIGTDSSLAASMEDGLPTDFLIGGGPIATMRSISGRADYGLIEDGAVLVRDGAIDWIGPEDEAPVGQDVGNLDLGYFDLDGRLLTPGLIDCHTHLVYGGDRSLEFEMRLEGRSYEDIARAGGGIVSSVTATREAEEATLFEDAGERLGQLIDEGVTTVEIKSGYGLDTATELKVLRVARQLGEAYDVDVVTTFLGAHALPAEYRDDREAYLRLVIDEMLPAVAEAGVADAVDGFCEGIAFSVEEMERVFDAAAAHDLPIKLHAEQLSNLGGAAMAARRGALSCDHLEYLGDDGVAAMADAGTVAVLLPGAFYYLRETQKPPVEALVEAGVPIAVATDMNPGSSPVGSLLASMNMACVLFGLTPCQALAGTTVHAARALGLDDRGVIDVGRRADLAVWGVRHPRELAYGLGSNPCLETFRAGRPVGLRDRL